MTDATGAPKKSGFWAIALYATAMNFSIRWLATGAATGPVALPVWILAAVLFLVPLVAATLELSARFPEEGAIYAWTRETQGHFAGFLCGWLYWACNLPYFVSLLYFVVNLSGQALAAWPATAAVGAVMTQPLGAFVASFILLIVITLMHARGFGVGKWLPVAGAAVSLTLALFIVAAALFLSHRDGSATHFATASYKLPFDANGAILWSSMVFAFGGDEGVALMRGEAKNGVKTLVGALVVLGLIQAVMYAGGTAAMLAIVPQDVASRLGGLPQALNVAMAKLHAAQGFPIVLLATALSLLGGMSAWFGAAARLPFAIGVDRMLPKAVGYRDPRTGAPTVALWLQAVLTLPIMALSAIGDSVAGAYDFVVSMGVLTFVIPYLWMFMAYWKVQSRPGEGLDFRTPGGPKVARLVAALGLIVAVSAILGSMVPSPDAHDKLGTFLKLILASAVMIGLGASIYAINHFRTRGQAHG